MALRQLAAIMFADIVGPPAVGPGEGGTISAAFVPKATFQPIVVKFGGRWIKESGDILVASFPTVLEAVLCAGAILQAVDQHRSQTRIGIHLGDIVIEADDVFGEGAIIASCLHASAPFGTIYVSDSVYNSIANKKGIAAKFLREEYLKAISDVIRIYEVSIGAAEKDPDALSLGSRLKKNGNAAPAKSIAVLPFVNMSNDPDQDYFGDGIAEEILNSLTHLKNLEVAGRTSSFQFKGKNVDIREIGQRLRVTSILEGSVRKQGKRLRISAQLINVKDGYHLWSERFDREMDDIFAIQDEIALAITEKLRITLLENEKAILEKKPTGDHEAYDLYLKGRFFLNKRGAGLGKALHYFQEAVEKDPDLALAYTGMADVYCILALYSSIPAHHGMPRARAHAEKALQSDPQLVEAYTSLAFISTFYDWNWPEAKKRFKHVFELNPDYAPAHYWYSYYLSFVEGRHDEGIEEARKAEMLEPLEPVPHHIASMMLINRGKLEEAVQASRVAISIDPNFFPGYRSLGMSLAVLKQYPEALSALQTAVNLSGRSPLAMVEWCWVYSLDGQQAEAEKIFAELLQRSATEFIPAMFLCCVAYFSKKEEEALRFIERAYEERDSYFPCIKYYVLFQFIRDDARFRPYIEKMAFPA